MITLLNFWVMVARVPILMEPLYITPSKNAGIAGPSRSDINQGDEQWQL
jgi:hypothetical protein